MFTFASNVSANKIVNFTKGPQHTFILIYFCYEDYYENIQIITLHNSYTALSDQLVNLAKNNKTYCNYKR